MIVTSKLSVEIAQYLNRRTQSMPRQWVTLGEIADHIYGPQDIVFSQAVDVARCRGWIIVEGNPTSRRAALTKAGCSLDLRSVLAVGVPCKPPTVSHERTGRQNTAEALFEA